MSTVATSLPVDIERGGIDADCGTDAAAWRHHLLLLVASVVALVLLFHADAADLAHLWWTSTTFGHCLFIGPVLAWLVWQRRVELAQLRPVAWAPGLLAVAAAGLVWLLGAAAAAAVLRQFGLLGMLEATVLTLLGPRVARGLLFPLGYAVFLVPFGEGIEGPLQGVTVAIVLPLLHLIGVAATSDGVLIHAGPDWFEVAEACSGAKFVLAMVAFGVLVANQGFRHWPRRLAFLVACIVVPVLANGLRAFATIGAAQRVGVAAATGVDHIIYGWLFFAVVMAALIAAAWRWFDRPPDAPAFDPAALSAPVRARMRPVVAAALTLLIAAAMPAWSDTADRPAPLPPHLDLPTIAGWTRAPLSTRAAWAPFYPGADHHLIGRYVDAHGDAVDIGVAVFARQHGPAKLLAFGTGVLREEDRWVRVADLPPIAGGAAMRMRAPGPGDRPVERIAASWYAVGDDEVDTAVAVKRATAEARLFGGSPRAIAVHLSAEVTPGHDPVAAITRFRAALGPLPHAAGLH